MTQTTVSREQLKSNRTMVALSELRLWEDNPREVIDMKRVTQDMRGAQTVPLLVMSDGTILGGNTRYQGMQAVGRKDVWVSVVEFDSENNKFIPYINGERDIKEFATVKDGMKHYALKNNQEYARYLEMEIIELAQGSLLNLDEYTLRTEGDMLMSLEEIMRNSDGTEVAESEKEAVREESKKTPGEGKTKKASKISFTLTFPVELVKTTETTQFEEWLSSQLDELMTSMLDQFKKEKDNG